MNSTNVVDAVTNSLPTSVTNAPAEAAASKPAGIYAFKVTDIDGNEVSLSAYSGKVLMIVNVASKCGFTGQYADLEKLYLDYKDKGLVVLGFPANNFLFQEPGTDAEIKQFCSATYNVTFPMFSKISVSGKDQHPLYAYLTAKETNPEHSGKISWNFNKFIIGRDGKVAGRFGSRTSPRDPKVIKAVEDCLSAGQPEPKKAD